MLAALIALLLVSLTGCSGDESTSVSFAVFGDPAEYAAYESLVGAFKAEHPDITIALQHVPSQGDYRQRLAAGFSSGSPPDVMLLNYRRFGTYADQGALAPLTDYLAASDVLDESALFPVVLDSFRWEGETWCIPQNVSSLVVYYNLDLFMAGGVPLPVADWTWTDFLSAARALTLDLDGDGRTDQYGVGLEPSIFRLAPFIWQNGGRLVDDEQKPTRLTLDEPLALDAFYWFVALRVEEGVTPDAVAEAVETAESRFLNGTLAMMFNSRRGVPTYRTIDAFSWDVAPLPRGRRAAGILHSDGYCLAAASQHKDAAWTFIEFANSAVGQEIVAASGRTVPSLMAVAASDAFLAPGEPPASSRVFVDTIPLLRRVPIMSTWAAIEEATGKEVERAFYGQITVEEAARIAIVRTEPFFEANRLGR
jgi:multiple sugar transport system substrate-binding protein